MERASFPLDMPNDGAVPINGQSMQAWRQFDADRGFSEEYFADRRFRAQRREKCAVQQSPISNGFAAFSRLADKFVRYISNTPIFACQGESRSIYVEQRKFFKTGEKMAASLREKLKHHRKEAGLSLDDLAKISETSKSYLWELENRDTRRPSAEKLTKIAEALSVTTGYLLDDKADLDEAHLKEAFFRKFNRLPDDDKQRIEEMVEAWSKKK